MYKVLLVLVVWLATCGMVEAQYTPYRLPEHVTVQVDGERHEAFNLGGFRDLLSMDEDLRHLEAEVPRLQAILANCEAQTTALLQVADIRLQDIGTLTTERDRLQRMWEEENRLRLEAEHAPDIGSWFGWALAAALGVATVVLVAVLAVGG